MEPLIQIEDFDGFRDISSNINELKRLDPYILEAQRYDLKNLLNFQLYHDFFANLSSQIYLDLLNGVDYTHRDVSISYQGLKPFLMYSTYARALSQQGVHFTKGGVTKKKVEESTPLTGGELQGVINQARDNAKGEASMVKDFLCHNSDSYPFYSNPNRRDVGGGISISASGGTRSRDANRDIDYIYE